LAGLGEEVDRVLAVEPNSYLAHFIKALIALGNGEPDPSLAHWYIKTL
jgi:hypothetical protein